jgi:hypothetical protein
MKRQGGVDYEAFGDEIGGVRCTYCDSDAVAVESLFAGTPSELLLRCRTCGSFFHWMKWRGRLPGFTATHGRR